jgi:hypothetical protein
MGMSVGFDFGIEVLSSKNASGGHDGAFSGTFQHPNLSVSPRPPAWMAIHSRSQLRPVGTAALDFGGWRRQLGDGRFAAPGRQSLFIFCQSPTAICRCAVIQ